MLIHSNMVFNHLHVQVITCALQFQIVIKFWTRLHCVLYDFVNC